MNLESVVRLHQLMSLVISIGDVTILRKTQNVKKIWHLQLQYTRMYKFEICDEKRKNIVVSGLYRSTV